MYQYQFQLQCKFDKWLISSEKDFSVIPYFFKGCKISSGEWWGKLLKIVIFEYFLKKKGLCDKKMWLLYQRVSYSWILVPFWHFIMYFLTHSIVNWRLWHDLSNMSLGGRFLTHHGHFFVLRILSICVPNFVNCFHWQILQKKPINYAPKVTFEFLDFLANGNCTSKVHKNRKNWARDLYEVAMTSYRSLGFF
jgi:hypothetical protein